MTTEMGIMGGDDVAVLDENRVSKRRSKKRSSSKRLSKQRRSMEYDEKDRKELQKRLSVPKRSSVMRNILSGSELTHINPFQTDETMSNEQYIKFILGVIFLVPLRMAVILITVLLSTLCMAMTVAGVDVTKPLPEERFKMQQRISVVTGRILCACFGIFDIRIRGERADPSECKMMVAAPHSTIMDVLVMACVHGGASGVGKAELQQSILGSAMVASQIIFVDREDPDNRKNVAKQIKERLVSKEWKRPLLIFPEGTCGNRTSLLQFKRGAFEPGLPVQPVVLSWEVAEGGFDPSWTAGSPSRSTIVLRCLATWQNVKSVTVTFLPVYIPSEDESQDSKLYSENVRAAMADTLKVTTTEFSNSDMFLAKVAAKRGLKPALALPFSIYSLQKELKTLNIKNEIPEITKKLLVRFSKAPKMDSFARLNEEQFEAIREKSSQDMELERSDSVQWQRDLEPHAHSDGTVSFRRFLLAHIKAKYENPEQ